MGLRPVVDCECVPAALDASTNEIGSFSSIQEIESIPGAVFSCLETFEASAGSVFSGADWHP